MSGKILAAKDLLKVERQIAKVSAILDELVKKKAALLEALAGGG